MNYSNDCGCAPAAAPKMIKTLSVAPAAATEEIVCPDARCLPHLLNSLPETDDAVPNYVGVYKGQSYIAPIRALVDSVLNESLNSLYRDGKVPTVVNYRDIESVPVIQKENCQKVAVTSMPTLAKAMTTALPAAPVGYEPVKVMTTDPNGDVYLATPVQVVSPSLIPAIIDNCEKGKIVNIPVIDRILGFGAGCKDFGATTLKQLQEAIAVTIPLAAIKTLPDTLLGYKSGKQERYPVTLNTLRRKESVGRFGSTKPSPGGLRVDFGTVSGPELDAGLWLVTITMGGSWGAATASSGYADLWMETPIGTQVNSVTTIPGTSVDGTPVTTAALTISRTVYGPVSLKAVMYGFPGASTRFGCQGDVTFIAQELSQTNLIVNDVK